MHDFGFFIYFIFFLIVIQGIEAVTTSVMGLSGSVCLVCRSDRTIPEGDDRTERFAGPDTHRLPHHAGRYCHRF